MAYREKDYIRRQMEMFARLLAHVLGLREGGRPDEALAEARRGAGPVLGLEYDTLARVDAASARARLRDPELVDAYAQLLELEADVLLDAGEPTGAEALRERAAAVRRSDASLA
jgi:hypothetical protein